MSLLRRQILSALLSFLLSECPADCKEQLTQLINHHLSDALPFRVNYDGTQQNIPWQQQQQQQQNNGIYDANTLDLLLRFMEHALMDSQKNQTVLFNDLASLLRHSLISNTTDTNSRTIYIILVTIISTDKSKPKR